MITPPPVSSQAPVSKGPTAGLAAPKTSPTLVGFQNKNTSIPDWRLQIQNAVQQRKNCSGQPPETTHHFPTNGGAALKAEPVRPPADQPRIEDARVANAMRRIEESRKAFLEPEISPKKPLSAKPTPSRPFGVVAPTSNGPAGVMAAKPPLAEKPKLVAPLPSSPDLVVRRVTNKLPPLVTPVATVENVDVPVSASENSVSAHPSEFSEIKRIQIKADDESYAITSETDFEDEIEDLAPFSMRFGAGLFDLIIGLFASLLILSPIAFSRSDWFTASSMLVFAGTTALVMFVYMTVCIGFFGKTMGMRLFSLELVDAVENEYPTMHQAAVNSSLFIISLALGGIGFVTVLFNEERRAVHDLLSGTILVREF